MKKLSFASIALLIGFVGLWEGQRTKKFVQGLHNRRLAEEKICLSA